MSLTAVIVTIGDELLNGQVVNTHATYLGAELDALGFSVQECVTIADKSVSIWDTLERLDAKVDLVLLTGGLGPTRDDVTKKVFCEYFQDSLVQDDVVLAHVKGLMEDLYKKPISDLNIQQALVPSKAVVLPNKYGTAPGLLIKSEVTYFVCLPGVPFEMKTIFQEELVPYLKANLAKEFNLHRTLITYGIGESQLAECLVQWEDQLPEQVSLAYLPNPGSVTLRLSCHGRDLSFMQNQLQGLFDCLPKEVFEYTLDIGQQGVDKNIVKQLLNLNKSISFAESFTGGVFAQLFSSNPGSSAYFNGGVVTYSVQSKVDVLGIDEELICKEGVVSQVVAQEMARNARRIFKSDYALATTGNAGPTQGDLNVPIGTIYIGIATPDAVYAKRFNLGQPREKVVQEAFLQGLLMIYREMIKNK